MRKGILSLVALAFVLAMIAPVFAEDAAQETKAATKPVLKNELVRLKYANAMRIQALLYPYLSRDGHISMMPNENVIVVSDVPENVEKALQVIKQLDAKPADLQFSIQLILGSEAEEKGAESLPNDPIIRELRNLLKYKTYSLLDTSLIRAMDNSDSEVRMGEKADFEFWIKPKVIKDEKSSLIQMEVRLRQIRIAGTPPNATSSKVEYITTDLIGTTLNIKPGDKTVVGVSKLDGSGKGLILIISGKIVE
jgi:hypothetical protein